MKKVYILLTRTGTCVSRMISFMTGDEYTHASISLDRSLTKMYSFGRKYEYFMLPGGFVREDPTRGVMARAADTPCLLFELETSDEAYDRIAARLDKLESEADRYSYSVIGVLLCGLDIACERRRHYFCSQFVARLLEYGGALRLPKTPALMHPSDFITMPELRLVYIGKLGRCADTEDKYENQLYLRSAI